MHWVTPKTERMLEEPQEKPEPVESPDDADDCITYDPTPYDRLGYRIASPVQEWKDLDSPKVEERDDSRSANDKENIVEEDKVDSRTAQRRKQFATRRESSIGAMLMTNKFDDEDLRKKFRTYEI